MANEITHQAAPGTVAAKFILYNADGQVWGGSSFAAWSDASIATYGVAMTADGLSGHFRGSIPPAITTPDRYTWVIYEQATDLPLTITDAPATLPGYTDWDGEAEVNAAVGITLTDVDKEAIADMVLGRDETTMDALPAPTAICLLNLARQQLNRVDAVSNGYVVVYDASGTAVFRAPVTTADGHVVARGQIVAP